MGSLGLPSSSANGRQTLSVSDGTTDLARPRRDLRASQALFGDPLGTVMVPFVLACPVLISRRQWNTAWMPVRRTQTTGSFPPCADHRGRQDNEEASRQHPDVPTPPHCQCQGTAAWGIDTTRAGRRRTLTLSGRNRCADAPVSRARIPAPCEGPIRMEGLNTNLSFPRCRSPSSGNSSLGRPSVRRCAGLRTCSRSSVA